MKIQAVIEPQDEVSIKAMEFENGYTREEAIEVLIFEAQCEAKIEVCGKSK